MAGLDLLFYEALARLPLGVVANASCSGPMGVAPTGSRRRLDFLRAGIAASAGAALLGNVLVPGRIAALVATTVASADSTLFERR